MVYLFLCAFRNRKHNFFNKQNQTRLNLLYVFKIFKYTYHKTTLISKDKTIEVELIWEKLGFVLDYSLKTNLICFSQAHFRIMDWVR